MQSRKEFLGQMAAGLAVVTAAAFGASPLFGGDVSSPAALAANVHTGVFVSADPEGKGFTMRDDAGVTHKHTLAPDAKVTDPEGKPCKITDLKAGQKIEVTTKDGDSTIALKLACVT